MRKADGQRGLSEKVMIEIVHGIRDIVVSIIEQHGGNKGPKNRRK